jgi:ABC-type proline/glycine betaine transport system permease subunit
MHLSYHTMWPYYLPTALMILAIYTVTYWNDVSFMIWVLYACIPIIDMIIGIDEVNPTLEE